MPDLHDLLKLAAQKKASDVFLKADCAPTFRIGGFVRQQDMEVLTPEDTQGLAYSIMTHEQIGRFEHRHELDLGFEIEGVCRIRANVYMQRGSIGLVCRLIPLRIFSLEQLGMPPVLGDFTKQRQGLVLVTGPTGSGKTTTLAALIDLINSTRKLHIVTCEDPIEFVHPDKESIVSQREVGLDTDSFMDALKYVLRQNPDVILIGEMRDIETMNVALAAAETGHLVFSTLHTASAAETLDRIINLFPPQDRDMLQLRLSGTLKGVISQKLIPRADGTGRIGAVEVMVATPTVSKLIEEGRASQIYGAIAEGNFWGMQTMNQCLLKYYRAGLISEEEALHNAGNVTEMKQMIRRPS
jgi:twitching motility protein PilT